MRVTNAIYRAQRYTHKWVFCNGGFSFNAFCKYNMRYTIGYKSTKDNEWHYIELREEELLDKSPKEIAKYIDGIVNRLNRNIKIKENKNEESNKSNT